MKILKLIGMAPLVLVSATAFAQGDDRAVPRGSGGGSSSGSDAGSRHSGSSSGGSATSGGSSGASSYSGSWAPSDRGDTSFSRPDAAGRRPRPGTGTGTRGQYGSDRDRYFSYPNPYYYYPYSYGWGYGRSESWGLYGYGYGYYDYPYGDYYPSSYHRYYRSRSGNFAQLRTLVEPASARVYVDGYYAGIVEDFDGLLQRLSISPGRHEITFKLEGYVSHTFSVYASADETVKLRWDMVKGAGETRDTIGEEYARRPDRNQESEGDPEEDEDRENESARFGREPGKEADSGKNDRPAIEMPPPGHGEISLDIQPPDASVYIDGEFHGKASQVTRLHLPAGRHRIEVVRPGYRTEETELDVDGEAKKVVVKLDRR